MTTQAERPSLPQSFRSASITILLVLAVIVGLGTLGLADDGPKPDPGTCAGDQSDLPVEPCHVSPPRA